MPRAVPDNRVVENAVLLACRAPSIHNSQPWQWRWIPESRTMQLFLDTGRRVRRADPSGREAIISCGAVLDHFRVAMASAGWQSSIKRFPDSQNPEHLASIELSPRNRVTDADREYADAILERRTDRLPFGYPTFWESFEPVLRSVVDDGDVMLDVLSDDARPQLARASQLTETLRGEDRYYQLELQWWTSPFALYEGVTPEALASASERHRVDVARDFPARSHADRRHEVAVDWSKILVLSTAKDTRLDALRCGEALSAVLLECTKAGLATCTLTHLIELPDSRSLVRELIADEGEPQALIRVGLAPPMAELPPATPRRPLEDVLQIG
ncbi:hypothetical protein MSP7336_02369 [Mycobacterium shimoidei]|uniref:NAD(P)H nitroreductase n=1 Tax=Mycobacterium shimoidei TaxID=29313 RepID=A0A375YYX1_MYCSH|nr:NAD(P)H nitroreductase [Mycobacterium shimoidei]SRX94121.1 hypothetical protein MSP7336_02369 [Mycobacterium shimoidei]